MRDSRQTGARNDHDTNAYSRSVVASAVVLLLLAPFTARAQSAVLDKLSDPARERQNQQSENTGTSGLEAEASHQPEPETAASALAPVAIAPDQKEDDSKGKQTKRILWVVPNFAAVSANTQLPQLSTREKFTLAMHDSVDYSSFVWAGVLAGQGMALKSYPELHHGAAAYSRYYWRAFADQASGAFFTEAVVPAIRHEDPRYFTLGEGSFFRRTRYALSRLVVTKTDSGGTSFNCSEILGNGLEAGVANLYYPPHERGLRKTGENWATGLESAALNNVIKEFWPDIRRALFRQK